MYEKRYFHKILKIFSGKNKKSRKSRKKHKKKQKNDIESYNSNEFEK